jgi:hypothetical protein
MRGQLTKGGLVHTGKLMKHFVVAAKNAPARVRLAGVSSGSMAAAPPSPHIGMWGFPMREHLFPQPFTLGPRSFFRHAHQHRSPATALSYCHDNAMHIQNHRHSCPNLRAIRAARQASPVEMALSASLVGERSHASFEITAIRHTIVRAYMPIGSRRWAGDPAANEVRKSTDL